MVLGKIGEPLSRKSSIGKRTCWRRDSTYTECGLLAKDVDVVPRDVLPRCKSCRRSMNR